MAAAKAIIGALLLTLSVFAVAGPVAASPCGTSGEGSGTCAFSCEGAVSVSASISSWVNQWRTIEGNAFCGNTLVATCADQGDCSMTGGTVPGASGRCVGETDWGVDFSVGCASSGNAATNIIRNILGTSATSCNGGTCIEIPVTCIESTARVACGVNVDADQLHEIVGW